MSDTRSMTDERLWQRVRSGVLIGDWSASLHGLSLGDVERVLERLAVWTTRAESFNDLLERMLCFETALKYAHGDEDASRYFSSALDPSQEFPVLPTFGTTGAPKIVKAARGLVVVYMNPWSWDDERTLFVRVFRPTMFIVIPRNASDDELCETVLEGIGGRWSKP